nr:C-type lectin domain family 2 member E-like [Jaculus jaculus]
MSAEKFSAAMLETWLESKEETGAKLQGECPAVISPVTLKKVHFCLLGLLFILSTTVVALSVALAEAKREPGIEKTLYATCPKDWIGFGSKCFYFSEDTRNWTFSQTSCLSLEAQLAQFDSLEELKFLRRYKGTSDHWIGLHRESSQHAWRWTDNTQYTNVTFIRGAGECAYLNDNGISSARVYTDRKWICSKSNSFPLQGPRVLNPF